MSEKFGENLHGVAKRLFQLSKKIHAAEGELPVLDRQDDKSQWLAWRSWRKDNGLSVSFMDKQQRWTVPTKWPPVDLSEVEQRYVGGRGAKVRLDQ